PEEIENSIWNDLKISGYGFGAIVAGLALDYILYSTLHFFVKSQLSTKNLSKALAEINNRPHLMPKAKKELAIKLMDLFSSNMDKWDYFRFPLLKLISSVGLIGVVLGLSRALWIAAANNAVETYRATEELNDIELILDKKIKSKQSINRIKGEPII
ncbi:MAG TPA: hypothetical protein VHA52_05825, partial [Candidatus Babeliaceae bacterium]|nr:hypothetical protein [Candidatus Babeliaceae bacterium]